VRRFGFKDLETILRTDYRIKGRRSLRRLEGALAHLRETFGSARALGITAERIVEYETERLAGGAARATVNYELAALRRAFRLALKQRRMPTPVITITDPHNARTGFFERADFTTVVEQLPESLKPVMQFAYLTGWRVASEVLTLTWDRVDFRTGTVRLEPNTTKNDEGRTFPFGVLPELVELLQGATRGNEAIERAESRLVPYVFHRNGQPIKSYKNAWNHAVARSARGGSKEALSESADRAS
jgi:integrase